MGRDPLPNKLLYHSQTSRDSYGSSMRMGVPREWGSLEVPLMDPGIELTMTVVFCTLPPKRKLNKKWAYCQEVVLGKKSNKCNMAKIRLRLFLKLSMMLLSLFKSIYRPAYTFSSNAAGDLEANSALPKTAEMNLTRHVQDTDFINILQNFPDEVK